MSDAALFNARAKRDAIAARINLLQDEVVGLKRQLADIDHFISDWYIYAGIEPGTESEQIAPKGTLAEQMEAPTPHARSKVVNPSREQVGRVVREILEEEGRPVLRADLFKNLADRGVIISGKDPEVVLSTMMWRMQEEFVRLPRRGYWFKDRPFPEAGYEPSSPTPRDEETQKMEIADLVGELPDQDE